jgi:hypothetical protein
MTTAAEIKDGMMANFADMLNAGTLTEDEVDRMVAFEVDGLDAEYRVGTGWCRCDDATDAESYWRRPDGRHGWFHDPVKGGCGGITQTG